MHFLKEHLMNTDYLWLEKGKKNIFTGQPTRRTFNRFNGDQVLFMINFYGSLTDQHSILQGKQIEDQLMNHLPFDLQSEISVFNWLRSATNDEQAAAATVNSKPHYVEL